MILPTGSYTFKPRMSITSLKAWTLSSKPKYTALDDRKLYRSSKVSRKLQPLDDDIESRGEWEICTATVMRATSSSKDGIRESKDIGVRRDDKDLYVKEPNLLNDEIIQR